MRAGFQMPTLAGAATAIDVPVVGASDLAAMALFGEASGLISTELHVRKKEKAEHREWLQGVTYQLIGMIISNGFAGLFKERIANFDRKRPATAKQINPFQIGLLATFAHDKGVMNEPERRYFGTRLWYAYRHYVPHEFLAGFLHQVWVKGAEERAATDYIEPNFVSWVMLQRAVDPTPMRRGQYPAAFEERVEQTKMVISALRGADRR